MADDRIYSGAEAARLLDAARDSALVAPDGLEARGVDGRCLGCGKLTGMVPHAPCCPAEAQVAGLRRLQGAARDLAASVVHHAARADALEAAVEGLRKSGEPSLTTINRLVQGAPDMEESAQGLLGGSVKRYLALEAAEERTRLETENRRLREELEKPVVGPWEYQPDSRRWVRRPTCDRDFLAFVNPNGEWWAATSTDEPDMQYGWSATPDACRHDADLVLVTAGFRLVGGVHPNPVEVARA